ncbi:hypothetical protein OEZ60_10675 [Defluviimonas sp. WL0024]|uniref:Uncharacterized protein n=1 Tax=Albidovulum salinarum TaxID=2984153 RepID=A0ABT2X3E9_9RHOB|nr:hypothetical protein [Defluviimonas sp. WL0024]
MAPEPSSACYTVWRRTPHPDFSRDTFVLHLHHSRIIIALRLQNPYEGATAEKEPPDGA